MKLTISMVTDLCKAMKTRIAHAARWDNQTRQLQITLLADCRPWAVAEGATAELMYKKGDCTAGVITQADNGDIFSISGHVVTVDIPGDLLNQQGITRLQVFLRKENSRLCIGKAAVLVYP